MQVLGKVQTLADGTVILPDGRRIAPPGSVGVDRLPYDPSWTDEQKRANG